MRVAAGDRVIVAKALAGLVHQMREENDPELDIYLVELQSLAECGTVSKGSIVRACRWAADRYATAAPGRAAEAQAVVDKLDPPDLPEPLVELDADAHSDVEAED